jgi:membrane-bound metal-dependent hydrolase YbcI (DUF457 family)
MLRCSASSGSRGRPSLVPGELQKSSDLGSTFGRVRNVTHELIGVSAAIAGSRVAGLDTPETAVAAVAAFHGSWLPDVDQLGSRIHRRSRLERRSAVVGAAGMLVRLPLVAFGAIVSHRALTHSALATVSVVLAVALVVGLFAPATAPVVAGGVGVGYSAHVLGDACTPTGVRLWWPFSARQVWLVPRRLRISTGSLREALLAVAVVGATAAFMLA